MNNDKCYVGLIKALPIPSYSSYVEDGDVFDIRDITNLVIKIDNIISATKFDTEMYDRFMKNEENKEAGDSANNPQD